MAAVFLQYKWMTMISFCSHHDWTPFKGYKHDAKLGHTDARILKWNTLEASLHWRWSVSVAEHRVEGMSKVVGLRAVVLLRHWQQEGKDHQQEQDELERQRDPEDAPQKRGPTNRRYLRIRREGTGSSVAARPAHTHTRAHTQRSTDWSLVTQIDE